MIPRIGRSQKAVTDKQLRVVEKSLKVRLPVDYRNFLLQNNGGKPEPGGFKVPEIHGRNANSRIECFLAVYDGRADSFEEYFKTYKENKKRVPVNLVPIGHDGRDNLICISTTGKDVGAIYFWDHDNESSEEGAEYDNVHLIADSFEAFLNALH